MKRVIQGFGLMAMAALLGVALQRADLYAGDTGSQQNLTEVTIYVTGMT